ncbi:CAP domain-containing protein [Cohnella sp.]|uniref:CAP domain-containing protein n=1 Tax=Cohnella sp. TaxID=1883426 RepID=UPI00356947E0
MKRLAIIAILLLLAACGNQSRDMKQQMKQQSKSQPQLQVSATDTEVPVNKYVVQSNESIQDIASKYHVSIEDFLRANPDLLKLVGGGGGGGNYANPNQGAGQGWGDAGRGQTGAPQTGTPQTGTPQTGTGNPGSGLNEPLPNNREVTIPSSDSMTGYELEVLNLTNAERQKAGLKPFSGDYSNLNRSARAKSEDMAKNNYFSHTSPTYGDPFAMMRNFGVQYQSAGENIAKGQPSPQQVVQAWMNSPGHRANIMNASYTHMGVGYVANNGQPCWTQQFVSK